MLRILKKYTLSYHWDDNSRSEHLIPGQTMSFSSYPGTNAIKPFCPSFMLWHDWVCYGSTVVEHLTNDPKTEGSSLVTGTGQVERADKMFAALNFVVFQWWITSLIILRS